MSAPRLTLEQEQDAFTVAREIGAAFRSARLKAGHERKNVAYQLSMAYETVGRFESGEQKNIKLGSIVRMLRHYGLTLRVVPIDQRGAA